MSGPAPERHLSDEDLSDLVDGMGGAEAEEHARECPSCGARLDGWSAMSRRLSGLASAGSGESGPAGSVGSEPAGRREEAVAAALAAGPPRSARHLKAFSALAAAAAVVIAVGFGVAHLAEGSGAKSASGTSSAASGSASGSGSAGGPGFPVASGTSASAAGSGGQVGSQLGALSGPAAVKAAVDRMLGAAQPAAASPSFGAEAGPAVGSSSSALSPGTGAACPDTGRLFPGSSAQLLAKAGAVYRATPATVYVYRVGAGRRAVVVDQRTCAVLADVAV